MSIQFGSDAKHMLKGLQPNQSIPLQATQPGGSLVHGEITKLNPDHFVFTATDPTAHTESQLVANIHNGDILKFSYSKPAEGVTVAPKADLWSQFTQKHFGSLIDALNQRSSERFNKKNQPDNGSA